MMENAFIWAQIFGAGGFILQLVAWQIKTPRLIILFYVPTNIFYSLQFFILGAMVGAFQAAVGTIKDGLIYAVSPKYLKWIVCAYLPIICFICINFFNNWYDVLPFAGSVCVNLALLNRDNRQLITRASLVSMFCWVIYNYSSTAYIAMAGEAIIATGVLIGMARHEKWEIGKCYRTFFPSLHRSLFNLEPRTYP